MRIKITKKSSIKPEQMGMAEFAKLAKVSESTAYRWRSHGLLEAIDAGSGTLDRAEVPEWIKRNVTKP